VGADLPQPSPSAENLSSQHPTYQIESVQAQPLIGLEEEIRQFEEKYANLVCSVLVAFEQGNVLLSDIKKCLITLPISVKLKFGSFLQSNALQLDQAQSISGLFFVLSGSPSWNFLNPKLLSHLVDKFGDGKTKQLRDKYLEELTGFRKRTKVHDFIVKWTGQPQFDTKELVMELKEGWRECNLEQLEHFRVQFLRKRWLEEYVSPVIRIEESCVDAVFSLPKSIDGHNLHLEDLCNFFLEYQVRRVLLNGVCILDLQVYIFFSCSTPCPYVSHIFQFITLVIDIAGGLFVEFGLRGYQIRPPCENISVS